jgi:hypothetical protein
MSSPVFLPPSSPNISPLHFFLTLLFNPSSLYSFLLPSCSHISSIRYISFSHFSPTRRLLRFISHLPLLTFLSHTSLPPVAPLLFSVFSPTFLFQHFSPTFLSHISLPPFVSLNFSPTFFSDRILPTSPEFLPAAFAYF